jgi:5'-methylthioadenosine phosphorylase
MAKQIVSRVIPEIPGEPNWPCHSVLRSSIMTDRKLWPAKTRKELAPLLAKYL